MDSKDRTPRGRTRGSRARGLELETQGDGPATSRGHSGRSLGSRCGWPSSDLHGVQAQVSGSAPSPLPGLCLWPMWKPQNGAWWVLPGQLSQPGPGVYLHRRDSRAVARRGCE